MLEWRSSCPGWCVRPTELSYDGDTVVHSPRGQLMTFLIAKGGGILLLFGSAALLGGASGLAAGGTARFVSLVSAIAVFALGYRCIRMGTVRAGDQLTIRSLLRTRRFPVESVRAVSVVPFLPVQGGDAFAVYRDDGSFLVWSDWPRWGESPSSEAARYRRSLGV